MMKQVLASFLVASVFLVSGSHKKTQTELTVMRICFNGDGSVLYPTDGEDTATGCLPTLVRWELLPIRVLSVSKQNDAVLEAIAHWNVLLGQEMFAVTEDEKSADILVMDSEMPSFWAGATRHFVAGGELKAVVLLSGSVTESDAMRVFVHEFGHALGLAHDRDRMSVMAPSLEVMAPEADVTKADVAALRSLYRVAK